MAKNEKEKMGDNGVHEKNARHTTAENRGNATKRERSGKERKPLTPDSWVHQIIPIALTALAALLGVCIYAPAVDMGILDKVVSWTCFGLLGVFPSCAAFDPRDHLAHYRSRSADRAPTCFFRCPYF